MRRIFPTVAVIDADGYRALTDDDIEARSQTLLQGAERGGLRPGADPRPGRRSHE